MAKNRSDDLSQSIKTALKKKDWDESARLLAEHCDRKPDDAKAWYNRAFVAQKLGRRLEATGFARKAVDLNPDLVPAQKLLDALTRQRKSSTAKPPSALSSTGMWTAGSVIGGRYEVKGSKKGGMGEVHFAFDRETARMVAVKTPLPEVLEDPASRARFYREAEAWIGLGVHANICAAYYIREVGGVPRLFIEYVGGGSLDAWLKQERARTFRQKTDLALQIASGLLHTHTCPWIDDQGRERRGLVHRDLKPANILMTKDGLARVTDFGLVGRGLEKPGRPEPPPPVGQGTTPAPGSEDEAGEWRTVTIGGEILGTPPYMAPEQWRAAHRAGFPVDIYAYGCILYEIFCGRRPLTLDLIQETPPPDLVIYYWQKIHTEIPAPDPRTLVPDLDEGLAELMLACLAKKPEDRPPDFETIRTELKEIHRRVEGWRAPIRPDPEAMPLASAALNNHGVSYMSLGLRPRAEEAWSRALKVDPHHIESNFNLALYEWRFKGLDGREAVRRLAEVRRTHADEWLDDHLLGRLCLFLKDFAKARTCLAEAVSVKEAGVKAWLDLGLAMCAEAGPGGDPEVWKRAEKIFRWTAERGYEDRFSAAGLYLCLKLQGREREAAAHYQEARSRLPDLPRTPDESVLFLIPGFERLFSISLPQNVSALAVSSDGTRTVIADENLIQTLALRAVDPAPLGETPWPDRVVLQALSADGRIAAALTEDSVLRRLEVETGRETGRTRTSGGKYNALALNLSGSRAATLAPDGAVSLWSADSEVPLAEVQTKINNGRVLALSPNAKYFLAAAEGSPGLWSFKTGRKIRELKGLGPKVTAAGFSADSRFVLAASETGELAAWDLVSGGLEYKFGYDNPVAALALSPDDRLLLTAHGSEAGARVLTLSAFPGRDGYRPPYVPAIPLAVSAAESREKEFLDLMDKARRHFDKEYFLEAFELLVQARNVEGCRRRPEAVELSRMLSARFAHKSLQTAWEIAALESQGDIAAAGLVDQGRTLVAARAQGGLDLWNLTEMRLEKSLSGPADPIRALAATGDGQRAVTGGEPGNLVVWDLKQGRVEKALSPKKARPINAAAISPDGRFALTGDDAGLVRLWDLEQGSLFQTFKGHRGPVQNLAFGPDGRLAVSGGADGQALVWDLPGGECAWVLPDHDQGVAAAAVSPDGSRILTSDGTGGLRCWTLGTEAPPRLFQDNQGTATSLDFDSGGRYALSGGMDRSMRLWDLERGGSVRVFEGHHEPVLAAAFAPDGQSAVSVGRDRIIRLWRLDWEPEIQPLSFQADEARPFLEIFLTLHTPYKKKGPGRAGLAEYTEADFKELLSRLEDCGLGRLRPQGVKNLLEDMAYYWTGPKDFSGRKNPKRKISDIIFRPFQAAWESARSISGLLSLVLPAVVLVALILLMQKYRSLAALALPILLYFAVRAILWVKGR